MHNLRVFSPLLVAGVLLSACGGEPKIGNGDDGSSPPVTTSRSGTQEHVVISSPVDSANISFELFEPDQVDPGGSYPLILHGHGYGGSRIQERSGLLAALTAAGYYVISIDQRGFGDSGGDVRVMSPDFEGQDLIHILDWAESLPGLARDSSGNMRLGAYGSSYGGGFQLLLLGADPKNRLDALAPDITWHDLRYSLNPNDVIKSGWVLALVAGGESGSGFRQDDFIRESLVQGLLSNEFPAAASNLFAYHSPVYHCEGLEVEEQDFLLAMPDPGLVPSRRLPKVDVLLTQGMRDTLFNFNEAAANLACLTQMGSRVRLLTHETGHILPASVPDDIADQIDPAFALVTPPAFQSAGGTRSCGNISLDSATLAWFDASLKGQEAAFSAITANLNGICMSLAEGDAIELDRIPRGGRGFSVDINTPQLNSALAVAGSLTGTVARDLVLADIPLGIAGAEGAVVAGIPQLALNVIDALGIGQSECIAPLAQASCDPIYWLALTRRRQGEQQRSIIDDQLTPLRGFGQHGDNLQPLDMTGVAERLAPGDELGLRILGFHAQYPVTWSRDIAVPAATFSGEVSVPIVEGSLDTAL